MLFENCTHCSRLLLCSLHSTLASDRLPHVVHIVALVYDGPPRGLKGCQVADVVAFRVQLSVAIRIAPDLLCDFKIQER